MKFTRRNWSKFSKLGRKRKKKQVWRSPKGRDNKIREKRKGYPVKVMVGFKQNKIKPKSIMVTNIKDLEKINKGETAMIGKVGMKKRIEIIKKAKEKEITFSNINVRKTLKKAEKKKEEREKQNAKVTETKKSEVKEKKK